MKNSEKWCSCILALAAILFLFSGTSRQNISEQRFVRAVVMEETREGVQVGLLCRKEKAAVDAEREPVVMELVTAQGESIPDAFWKAERLLKNKANYKQCDYILCCRPNSNGILSEYKKMLLAGGEEGRLSAWVYAFAGDMTSLPTEWTTQEMALLRAERNNAPRLHEADEAVLLLPQLCQADQLWRDGAALLATGEAFCKKIQDEDAQLLWLLQNRRGKKSFMLQGEKLELQWHTTAIVPEGRRRLILDTAFVARRGERQWLEQLLQTRIEQLLRENPEIMRSLLGLDAHSRAAYGNAAGPEQCMLAVRCHALWVQAV